MKKVIKQQLFFLERNILIILCFHVMGTGSSVPVYSVAERRNVVYLFLLCACEKCVPHYHLYRVPKL